MQTYEWFRPGLSLDQELRRWYTLVGSEECYWLSVNEGPDTAKSRGLLRNALRSELKFVISFGATKENTVQVDTVPLKSLQVTPLTLRRFLD